VDGGMNGTDVRTGPVTLSETAVADGQVEATPRIGISKAVERPWRFVLV
ncbi:MAG: 3-methyladenine DNA glycosylase, partial [Actinobacteria bacterium]|nr:3-methyladenine DNA glycosylase [Actinomycetota bacterium]NIS32119.1 3-methyladenine DNA glycosylase [Actinomycetota bacterium]NIU19749.1 3-methyladenine DNA glycosylase [Actinomycetota bacterium]NIU67188.1 3-methyladenine DNA glycosylase [Actinomycetota bacterium]NIV56229.1 3-methyladenine DNA glycosylase [Actinomycetota bacterium]